MLSGRVEHADNRADLVRLATERATAYYGTGCVAVTLLNESEETDYERTLGSGYTPTSTLYGANYTAKIEHNLWEGSYGALVCRHCQER